MHFTAEKEESLLANIPKKLMLGGVWVDSSDGETMPVFDPATGLLLAEIASASAADGLEAMNIAAANQESWSKTAPRVRGEILRKAFEIVTARASDFAAVMSMEMGKPYSEALGEVAYGAEFLRWFSEEAVRVSGRLHNDSQGRRSNTTD